MKTKLFIILIALMATAAFGTLERRVTFPDRTGEFDSIITEEMIVQASDGDTLTISGDGTDFTATVSDGNFIVTTSESNGDMIVTSLGNGTGNAYLRAADATGYIEILWTGTTAALRSSAGTSLKLQNDALANILCFSDNDVGDNENGKLFRVQRRASEGDDNIDIYIDKDKVAHITGSEPIRVNQLDWTKQNNLKLVVEGDSLSNEVSEWPTLMMNYSSHLARGNLYNFAEGNAEVVRHMEPNYAAQPGTEAPEKIADEAIFFLLGGTNDLQESVSASDIYVGLQSLWSQARADGFKVVAMTVPGSTDYTGAIATEWAALNALITADPCEYDYLVQAHLMFPDANDTTYFDVDGVHLNATGQARLARAVATSIGHYYTPIIAYNTESKAEPNDAVVWLHPASNHPMAISELGDVTINGTTLSIGDADEEDNTFVINANANDWHWGIDDTDDYMKWGLGTAQGTTDYMVMTPTGWVGYGTSTPDGYLEVEQTAINNSGHIRGIISDLTKTGGSTLSYEMHATDFSATMNHSGGSIGDLVGVFSAADVIDGTVNFAGYGVTGVYGLARISGGTSNNYVRGMSAIADLNTGTVNDKGVQGLRVLVDIESSMTDVNCSVYGIYLEADVDKDPTGSAYGLYINDLSGVDYAIYQNGTAPSRFGGNVLVENASFIPDVHVISSDIVSFETYGVNIISSAGSAITGTLADGTTVGQTVKFVCKTAGNPITITVSHHVTSDPEDIQLDTAKEWVTLMWDGTDWVEIDGNGQTYP